MSEVPLYGGIRKRSVLPSEEATTYLQGVEDIYMKVTGKIWP